MKYNKIRTLYIKLKSGKTQVATTKEVMKDKVYADFDPAGKIIGFEFIDPYEVELDGEISMWNNNGEGDQTSINHISVFKCVNGFGIETTTAVGEDGFIKRYVATNLDQVHDFISKYFQGELDG